MEQQQRSLVFTAAVGLIILAIIVGSVYYLVKFIQTRVSSSRQSPQASVESIAEASAFPVEGDSIQGEQAAPSADRQNQGTIQSGTSTPQVTQTPKTAQTSQAGESKGGIVSADKKIFDGGNFQLSYPKNWGVMACTNSKNLEFDPVNNADFKEVCNYALKPITVLVADSSGCSGDAVKFGNVQTSRSVQADTGYVKYQWCTKTTPVLNITHRVSKGNDPASSKEDYSKQIEEMIGKLTFSRGS